MKRNAGWVLVALLVGLGARGQDLPLPPLTPPPPNDAPWLKKNQKPPAKKKPVAKKKKKKESPQAVESKAGAPTAASPPPAQPPLALPPLEPLQGPEPAKPPVEVAKPAAVPPPTEPPPPPPLVPLSPAPPPTQVSGKETGAPAPVAAVTAAPPAPAPRSNWQKPTALAALGLGVAAGATALYFGVKSHSDLNDAESAFHVNGGAYTPADVQTLNSGNSAAKTANILFVVSGALLATSALVAFAF